MEQIQKIKFQCMNNTEQGLANILTDEQMKKGIGQ